MSDCYGCDYYDSSVDACNCDDKCYVDGLKKGVKSFAKFLMDKNVVVDADMPDLVLEFLQEGQC